MSHTMPLPQHIAGLSASSIPNVRPKHYELMEKKYHQFKENKEYRDAYVESETVTFIAHQIRAIRDQRGWTQKELAKKMNTTQAAISRIEDPSYGKFSVKTLLELCFAFDVGIELRFVSTAKMLIKTFKPNASDRLVEAFQIETQDKNLSDFLPNNKAFTVTFASSAPTLPIIDVKPIASTNTRGFKA